ncbi:DUF945 family protein [Salinicola sp. DM10]|uniref:DUF945 family protein n=1 Tax=Salinicola sp. DM10 TaxID=2815721 RepID=UPI001A8F5F1E|nr:DUF945 family protein [Salinicola sp. DM10]MCE3027200.1 YdgA family protein [Salinicola sp. DM10]
MRKWIGAGAAIVIVVGGGYLGAQAYSSHRFEQEMSQLVARLDASPQWQVERTDVDSGWFHSSGRLEARYLDDEIEPVVIEAPYEADHGLFETSFSGEGQVRIGDDQTLFGDLLQSDGPLTWNGRFLTREQRMEATIALPGFSQQWTVPAGEVGGEFRPARPMQVDFSGLTLNLTQHADRVTLDGQAPRLQLQDADANMLLENVAIEGAFQGDRQAFDQSLALTLPTITVVSPDGAKLVSHDSRYALDAKLDAKEMRMHLETRLGDTTMDDQQLGSGELAMTLDHVDGDAYRALAAALEAHTSEIQAAAASDDQDAMAQALAPLKPQLAAIFAGSPRWAVDKLALKSPLMGVDMQGSGELKFDGDGMADWNLDTMDAETLDREVLKRLDGHFELKGAPPILLMSLGLPMSGGPLRIALDDGVMTLNDQQVPLVPGAAPAQP